jgi:hypothetical protein
MKRWWILIFLFGCSGQALLEGWERRSEKEPVSVLREIGDSLSSPSFRKKASLDPTSDKILDLALRIALSLNYRDMPIDSLIEAAQGLKGVIAFLYDFGKFDENWTNSIFAYKQILKSALAKMEKINSLDSLEYITKALEPLIMAGSYRGDYERLIDLYRERSVSDGTVRWGMSEEDVIKVFGEPERVDTVYSVSMGSFGKMMIWKDKGVLVVDGKVYEVFER